MGKGQDLFNAGCELCDTGKYQEALTKFFEALTLKCDVPKSAINRNIARCYEELNNYNKALKYADIALNDTVVSSKTLYDCLYVKVNIFTGLGRKQEALECIDRILNEVKDDPNHANTLYGKATLTNQLGYCEESLPWFQKALEAGYDPVMVYNGIATAYDGLKKFSQALANYDKGLKHNPNSILILCNKASTYNSIGEYDKAIECYTRISEIIATEGFASIENVTNAADLIKYAQDSLANEYQKLLLLKSGGGNIAELRVAIDSLKTQMGSFNEELADHKAILDDSGATDKALVKRGFAMLADNPEASNYAKTFYWLTLNYIMAYRTLSTGLVQADIDAAQTASDQVIKGVVKKATSIGAELCGSIPIVGGLFGALNHIIDDLYEGILQGRTVNKGKAIAAILRAKFDLEDEISITVAKIALGMAKIRADEITINRKISDVNIRSAISKIMEKIDKFKDKILPSVDLEDSEGAKMAVRDMTMMFAYVCANYEKICKNKNPIEEIFKGIITSGSMDETLGAMADYNPKLEYKAAASSKTAHDSKAAYESKVPPPTYEEIGNPALRSKSPTKSPVKSNVVVYEQKALSSIPSYEAHNDNSGRKAKSPVKNKAKSPDKGKNDKGDKCIVMKFDDITYNDPLIDAMMKGKGKLPPWMLSLLNTSTKNNACYNAIVDSLTDNKSLDTNDVSSAILGLNEYSDNQQ